MHRKPLRLAAIVSLLSISLVLGGCGLTTKGTTQTESKKDSPYVPVQDYVGQGYSFANGEQTGVFPKTHRQEIIAQVNKFFKTHYNLEVTTHNLVGAKDAVVAFVESKGEPHFHTSVIVDVDTASQKVTGHVWAYEGDVEAAITSGLYEMAYEKEFKNLDRFVQSATKEFPVIGLRQEAIERVLDVGYATPFYNLSTSSLSFPTAYKAYMKNHNISKNELRKLIQKKPFGRNDIDIALRFYMRDKHASPDKRIAKQIIAKFKSLKNIAPGDYAVFVLSNDIQKRVAAAKNIIGTIPGKDDIIKRPNE